MSVRGIGEGHLSTHRLPHRDGDRRRGSSRSTSPSRFPSLGTGRRRRVRPGARSTGTSAPMGSDGESAAYVLDHLGATFTADELDVAARPARPTSATRGATRAAPPMPSAPSRRCSYAARLPRRLRPVGAGPVARDGRGVPRHGGRPVRALRRNDGAVAYYATYTAFDGVDVSQQLLRTTDFVTFAASPMSGPGRAQQGPGAVPAPDRRSLRRALPPRPRDATRSRSPTRIDHWGTLDHRAGPPVGLGDDPARQLRLAHRDRRRLAGADPRRRADAHVQHRRAAARPRRPDSGAGDRRGAAARPRRPTSRTATCRTSSTRAARCCTATRW